MPRSTLVPMPKPKTGRPAGRPKGDRQTDAHAYVRMTSDERQTIERAITAQSKNPTMIGARVTVSSFLLAAGLAAAREVTGEK
jgi:hypothetical protein